LNKDAINLGQQIRGLNRFWSRFLTQIFILDVALISYSVYIIFLVNIEFHQKHLFLLIMVYVTIALTILIYQCARIVRNSEQIDRLNRYFLIYFMDKKFTIGSILKV